MISQNNLPSTKLQRSSSQQLSVEKTRETKLESVTTKEISASVPDWSREKCVRWWEPSRQLLKSIRKYQKWQDRGGILGSFLKRWHVIGHRFWSIVTGADIPINCQIEGGLILPHPNGVIIDQEASIGPNCSILQQVTIVRGVQMGGHVQIGAGAKIIAQVRIGNHAKIGANAVVLCDVPEGATAVGVPARIIPAKATPKLVTTVAIDEEQFVSPDFINMGDRVYVSEAKTN